MCGPSLLCCSVLSMMLSWLPVAQCAARTYSAYFRCLIRFARSRSDLRQWMVDHGSITAIVQFYTCSTPVPQFNCRVSPPVLSYIVQQQQVSAPRSLHEAHATLLASFAASANGVTVRRMHPHHGNLAITLLALLVQHVATRTRKLPHGAKQQPAAVLAHLTSKSQLQHILHLNTFHPAIVHPITTATDAGLLSLVSACSVSCLSDRRALLTGLLTQSNVDEGGNATAARSHAPETSSDSPAANNVDSRMTTETAATTPTHSSEQATSTTPRSQPEAESPSPTSASVAPASRPAALPASSAFPFFPYVISDSSCCLAVASLTSSLAANDSRISSAVLDCVLAALNDALQGQAHRVYGGIAVANAALRSDSGHQPPSAANSPSQPHQPPRSEQPTAAVVLGVHDFVGPLTALSALLSLSDRLVDSRTDECLSRLLVMARRVCDRRPSAVCPPGKQCLNGSEERFLLAFVRCVLQLAANHRPIAAWLKAHANEWHCLETLYTQARHMTGMQLIKAG